MPKTDGSPTRAEKKAARAGAPKPVALVKADDGEKKPSSRKLIDALVKNMDAISDEDVEAALRGHLKGLPEERLKQMHHHVVLMPEERTAVVVAGLALLEKATPEQRRDLGVPATWGAPEIREVGKDFHDGMLEVVEVEEVYSEYDEENLSSL